MSGVPVEAPEPSVPEKNTKEGRKRWRIDSLSNVGGRLEVKAREVVDPKNNILGIEVPPFYIDLESLEAKGREKYLIPGRDLMVEDTSAPNMRALYGVTPRGKKGQQNEILIYFLR